MSAERTDSRKTCLQALKAQEESLIGLPEVVGLGVVKDAAGRGHHVALYMSRMPDEDAKRSTFPETLEVPDTDQRVTVELVEIGGVEVERETIEALP